MSPMRSTVQMFSRHRNAANLLFISMIMFGFFGLSGLNTQFFPTTEIKIVNINVPWLARRRRMLIKISLPPFNRRFALLMALRNLNLSRALASPLFRLSFTPRSISKKPSAMSKPRLTLLSHCLRMRKNQLSRRPPFLNQWSLSCFPAHLRSAPCALTPSNCGMAC